MGHIMTTTTNTPNAADVRNDPNAYGVEIVTVNEPLHKNDVRLCDAYPLVRITDLALATASIPGLADRVLGWMDGNGHRVVQQRIIRAMLGNRDNDDAITDALVGTLFGTGSRGGRTRTVVQRVWSIGGTDYRDATSAYIAAVDLVGAETAETLWPGLAESVATDDEDDDA